MAEDELAARRAGKRQRAGQDAPSPPSEEVASEAITVEELGWELGTAYIAAQRAVALEESEVKLAMRWRDVERWTGAYIAAVREQRDGQRW